MILRAKTIDLFSGNKTSPEIRNNSQLNLTECEKQTTICQSYPRRIVLELTNACNMNCIMCGRNDVKFTPTYFDVSMLKVLKPVLPYVEEVTLMGWGEPTLHPRFKDILHELSAYENLRIYFCTNGMRLADLCEDIFSNRVDVIAISLDGARAETNNRIRRGSDFDFICDSLRKIVAYKKAKHLSYPYMNFVFTAMNSNLQELPDMVRLASNIGLEEVKVVYLTVFGDKMLSESLYNQQEKVRQVFDEVEKLGDSLGIKIKLPYIQGEDPAGNQSHKKCFVAWRDFFLGSDNYVRPCMSTPIKFFELDHNASFMEKWNDKAYQEFRAVINNGNCSEDICNHCYQSSHTNWNRKESFIQIGENFAPEWNG